MGALQELQNIVENAGIGREVEVSPMTNMQVGNVSKNVEISINLGKAA